MGSEFAAARRLLEPERTAARAELEAEAGWIDLAQCWLCGLMRCAADTGADLTGSCAKPICAQQLAWPADGLRAHIIGPAKAVS